MPSKEARGDRQREAETDRPLSAPMILRRGFGQAAAHWDRDRLTVEVAELAGHAAPRWRISVFLPRLEAYSGEFPIGGDGGAGTAVDSPSPTITELELERGTARIPSPRLQSATWQLHGAHDDVVGDRASEQSRLRDRPRWRDEDLRVVVRRAVRPECGRARRSTGPARRVPAHGQGDGEHQDWPVSPESPPSCTRTAG